MNALARPALALVAAVLILVASGCRPSHGNAQASKTPNLHSPSPIASAAPALGSVAGCPSGQIVSSTGELKLALENATPGSVLLLAPGTYSDQFVASVS